MGSTFSMCMHCGCNENDVAVFKCHNCGTTFCFTCANHGFFSTGCPKCESGGSKLGNISR